MINAIPKTIAAMMLTFKLILNLNNNWEEYKKSNRFPIREVEVREVEKMLGCMDPQKGYSVYMCVDCGKTKKLPHSCKSRICSVCGKKHADEWAEKINKEMYAVPLLKKLMARSNTVYEKEEKQEKAGHEEGKETECYQLCLY
jgi:hypothetical protein